MIELEILTEDLQKYLNEKKLELILNSNFDSYTDSLLSNRLLDIIGFRLASKNSETHPLLKKQIIENFKKSAAIIKSEIDKITCNRSKN